MNFQKVKALVRSESLRSRLIFAQPCAHARAQNFERRLILRSLYDFGN